MPATLETARLHRCSLPDLRAPPGPTDRDPRGRPDRGARRWTTRAEGGMPPTAERRTDRARSLGRRPARRARMDAVHLGAQRRRFRPPRGESSSSDFSVVDWSWRASRRPSRPAADGEETWSDDSRAVELGASRCQIGDPTRQTPRSGQRETRSPPRAPRDRSAWTGTADNRPRSRASGPRTSRRRSARWPALVHRGPGPTP